jgi:hypothetical protein|tara:strand:+ start:2331 stop:2816 length:486 start_codon:yes stop_codon:yes gene_type:complete
MASWYQQVVENIAALPECIDYFEGQLAIARNEIKFTGSIEKAASAIPAIVQLRFSELQEIEAILEHLNIHLRKLRAQTFRMYLEKYNRQLSSRDASAYVDGEQVVVDQTELINEFGLLRNQFLGVLKALEAKQFQINNIVKLRVAGLEDSEINMFYGNPNK